MPVTGSTRQPPESARGPVGCSRAGDIPAHRPGGHQSPARPPETAPCAPRRSQPRSDREIRRPLGHLPGAVAVTGGSSARRRAAGRVRPYYMARVPGRTQAADPCRAGAQGARLCWRRSCPGGAEGAGAELSFTLLMRERAFKHRRAFPPPLLRVAPLRTAVDAIPWPSRGSSRGLPRMVTGRGVRPRWGPDPDQVSPKEATGW